MVHLFFPCFPMGPAAVTAEVKDNGDGTYAISYTAKAAGVYELHITLGEWGLACLGLKIV